MPFAWFEDRYGRMKQWMECTILYSTVPSCILTSRPFVTSNIFCPALVSMLSLWSWYILTDYSFDIKKKERHWNSSCMSYVYYGWRNERKAHRTIWFILWLSKTKSWFSSSWCSCLFLAQTFYVMILSELYVYLKEQYIWVRFWHY